MGACFDSGEVKVPERWEGGSSWHGMETETARNPDEIEASRDMFLARLEEPGRRATLACQCGELREIPTTQPGIGLIQLARLGISILRSSSSSTCPVAVSRHRMMEAGDETRLDGTALDPGPGRARTRRDWNVDWSFAVWLPGRFFPRDTTVAMGPPSTHDPGVLEGLYVDG